MSQLHDFNITEPIFLRNLVIFPITFCDRISSKQASNTSLVYSTIDEIVSQKKGEFRELDEPEISRIVFNNNGNNPVVILDGEEITGAYQNRICARSSIVEARSSKTLSVICAEEGRWNEIGGFKTGYCSYPKLRSILLKSRYKKLNTQELIWREISRKLTVTKTISTTSSMHDMYENLDDEVARYVEDFTGLNHNTVGFVASAGNCILGCDIFINTGLYQKCESKLIKSYAIDAIEYQRIRGRSPEINEFFTKIKQTFDRKNLNRPNIKVKGKNFLGQSLIHNNHLIHLSSFPN